MGVLLVLTFIVSSSHASYGWDMKAGFYEIQDNMTCSAVESVYGVTGVRCTAKCNLMTDNACIGVSYNATYCELCLACPRSNNTVQFSRNSSFKRNAANFTADLLEGI